jgi:hypothetical protein
MNQSNKLCESLQGFYDSFKKSDVNHFTGYKLVQKINLNYYSIVTGLFRYKSKSVSENSYHTLHQRDGNHYDEHLVNRVAVFEKMEHAQKAMERYKEVATHRIELVIMEIEISKDLESATFTNSEITNAPVMIGSVMDKTKEIKSIYNNIHNNE